MSLHFRTNNNANKIMGKGFYIALGVCLIAIGVAAWTTYDSVVKYANPADDNQSKTTSVVSQSVKQTQKTVGGITGKPESDAASKASSSAISSQTASKPAALAKSAGLFTGKVTYSYPVSKNVSKKYSGDNPIYSETMQDWRVHSGTDFSAQNGDGVSAIADGKVTDIYKDDLLGNVIVIAHKGNVVAKYCGLGDTALVKKGAEVKSGQKIGSVSTVPCEQVEKTHLHLEIMKDGKQIDPTSIFSSVKQ